ncbi:MAG: hypothetical protein ACW98Y_11745 [Candidatus Thorarchaeota archaeon]|jgi:hypothetical protein
MGNYPGDVEVEDIIEKEEKEKIRKVARFMKPGESVKWAAKRSYSFINYILGTTIAIVLSFIFISPIPLDSPISLIGYLYCIVVFSIAMKDVIFPQWYIITSKRILRTKGRKIMKEIDLSRFGKRPLQRFVGMRIDRYEDKNKSDPVYDITIYDPDTSGALITFKDIMGGAVYFMESKYFRNMQECASCGMLTSKNVNTCHGCGDPFHL